MPRSKSQALIGVILLACFYLVAAASSLCDYDVGMAQQAALSGNYLGAYKAPQWSLDGKTLVVNLQDEIYTLNGQDPEARSIADGDEPRGFQFSPSVSATGQIAYRSFHFCKTGLAGLFENCDTGDSDSSIRSVDLYGSNDRLLGSPGKYVRRPIWSPDGSRVAFLASFDDVKDPHGDTGRVTRLGTMNADGSDVRIFDSIFQVGAMAWSADGSHIAAVDSGSTDREKQRISIVAWNSDDIRTVVDMSALDHQVLANELEWSAATGLIYFVQERPVNKTLLPSLFSVASDGSHQSSIFANDGRYSDIYGIDVSPDGDHILFATKSAWEPDHALHVMKTDGTEHRRSANVEDWIHASWSPDGTRIAVHLAPGDYLLSPERYAVVFSMARDGSDARLLFELKPGEAFPQPGLGEPPFGCSDGWLTEVKVEQN